MPRGGDILGQIRGSLQMCLMVRVPEPLAPGQIPGDCGYETDKDTHSTASSSQGLLEENSMTEPSSALIVSSACSEEDRRWIQKWVEKACGSGGLNDQLMLSLEGDEPVYCDPLATVVPDHLGDCMEMACVDLKVQKMAEASSRKVLNSSQEILIG
ncbi:hypothetical protein F0562_025267 [Nyssa sinensis]|uniref:Uncharacterized protein n=1 Tax=Nyssa sinensis TaxID=561372 RepID=A0A5J5BEY9_9ASTE|nr:hypothetical protein F0562_025267 [Nyssa sinensis]